MSTGGKVLLGAVVTAVVSSLVALFFTVYGPTIGDWFASGPPVDVAVQNQADPTLGGAVYALPGTLSSRPATLAVGQPLATVVENQNAAQVNAVNLKLVLTGKRSQAVVITNLTAHVLTRSRPLGGTLLYAPAQGVNDNINGCVYLDSMTPTLLSASDGLACAPTGKPYFTPHNLKLALGEQVVVNVAVRAGDENQSPETYAGYYEWEFVLDAVVDGKSTEIPIRDGASPFRLTSYAPNYLAMYYPDYNTADAGPLLLRSVDPAEHCRPSCAGGLSR